LAGAEFMGDMAIVPGKLFTILFQIPVSGWKWHSGQASFILAVFPKAINDFNKSRYKGFIITIILP
jgi:hypothetical protein